MREQIESATEQKTLAPYKIAKFVIIALLCAFGWFGVRTQIGNMLAERTSPSQEDAKEVAELAISLAPSDPLPRRISALALRRSFVPDELESSVRRFEEAVHRNPNDYRCWNDLARGYEQSERYIDAEAALRRSIELAPAYAIPHWQMANFLIRQQRVDEAKAELKQVTKTSSPYRAQAFGLVWDYFDKDPAAVEEIAFDSAEARLTLANFYANRESGQNSLRIWNSLTPAEKSANPEFVRLMAYRLSAIGAVWESLSVARDIGMVRDEQPETINNGGFETSIGEPYMKLLSWTVFRNNNKFDALPDSEHKVEGSRSMKVVFRNYSDPDLYNIVQIVAVQPLQKYRLSLKVRTENLRGSGPPYLEVVAYNSYRYLANSSAVPVGSHDWREVSFDFSVPAEVTGIEVRTRRISCPDLCTLNGTLWYDDFRISRI